MGSADKLLLGVCYFYDRYDALHLCLPSSSYINVVVDESDGGAGGEKRWPDQTPRQQRTTMTNSMKTMTNTKTVG